MTPEEGVWWWLSNERFTVGVRVLSNGRIVQGPPIVGKFLGQQLGSLQRWMEKMGGYKEERL